MKQNPLVYKPDFEGEIGDVLFSLIQVANYFDINLNETLETVMKKYSRRFLKG